MRCLRDHPSAPCSFVTSCVGGRFECSRLRIATPWQAAPPRRIFFASLIAEEAPRRVPPPAAWSRVLLGPAVTVRPVCGVVPHAPHRHGSSRKRVPPCRRATGPTAHRAKLPPTGAAPAPVRDGASLRSVESGCLRRCSATAGIMCPVYPEPAEGPPKTCRPATNRHAPHRAGHIMPLLTPRMPWGS